MKKKIPVIVVSGFLGSGKTTFLRYLLKESNKKFGFIINEFGDVGIDGDLIRSCDRCDESEDDCVIELNNKIPTNNKVINAFFSEGKTIDLIIIRLYFRT